MIQRPPPQAPYSPMRTGPMPPQQGVKRPTDARGPLQPKK